MVTGVSYEVLAPAALLAKATKAYLADEGEAAVLATVLAGSALVSVAAAALFYLLSAFKISGEAIAALQATATLGKPVWTSFTLHDQTTGPPTLRGDEYVGDAVAALENAKLAPQALLYNCCAPQVLTMALRQTLDKLPESVERRVPIRKAAEVERWTDQGWVDLRPSNVARWRARFNEAHKAQRRSSREGSSQFSRETYPYDELRTGEIVGWIFNHEPLLGEETVGGRLW